MSRDWPKELREHAEALDKAAAVWREFTNGDEGDRAEELEEIAESFRSEAADYEKYA